MKLDGPRWTDTFMGHIVVALICTLDKKKSEEYYANRKDSPGGVDVTVTIDGMEFDFKLFAERVEKQIDVMVTEEAGKMLKEKTFDLTDKLQNSIDELVNGIRKQASDMLGYNPWEYER